MRSTFAVLALVFAVFPVAVAEGPASAPGAADAVAAGLDVERALLKEDLEAWSVLTGRLADARRQLESSHDSLDAAVRFDGGLAHEKIEALLGYVEAEASALDEVIAAERVLLERIRERRRKIVLLEEKVSTLQIRAGSAAGPMTATWDVSLLPSGQRGRFFLSQNGVLVSGTYVFDGGFSGSLQGTFVNRKIVLERIDSRLGRWGRFEGFLSPDGARVRGSWLRLELAGGDGGEGQWTAVRAAPQP